MGSLFNHSGFQNLKCIALITFTLGNILTSYIKVIVEKSCIQILLYSFNKYSTLQGGGGAKAKGHHEFVDPKKSVFLKYGCKGDLCIMIFLRGVSLKAEFTMTLVISLTLNGL